MKTIKVIDNNEERDGNYIYKWYIDKENNKKVVETYSLTDTRYIEDEDKEEKIRFMVEVEE